MTFYAIEDHHKNPIQDFLSVKLNSRLSSREAGGGGPGRDLSGGGSEMLDELLMQGSQQDIPTQNSNK